MINQRLLRYYKRYRGRTGCVGRDAQGAFDMAVAVIQCEDAGCYFEWSDDYDGWVDIQANHGFYDHRSHIETVEQYLLCDSEDNVLASLQGIADADALHRRMVEADLALAARDALLAYTI